MRLRSSRGGAGFQACSPGFRPARQTGSKRGQQPGSAVPHRPRKTIACATIAFAVLSGCVRKPDALPNYGRVPSFVLTDQTGQEFRSEALNGKIWVADFMFTNCMGPCPRMTSQMHRVGNELKGLPDVRFVSFTVDPARDTPQALAEYANRFHADTSRWFFLTGAQQSLHELNRNAFKLGNVDGSLTHSTRFVLVDGQTRIRGYYDTSEDGSLDKLVGDIRRLAREKS